MKKRVAIFTGASSGIGREFVKQIDQTETFDEIWLIARRRDRLEEIGKDLRAPVKIMPLDLGDPAAIESYKETLANENPDVAVLVNAAGFGRFSAFTETDLNSLLDMIELNSKALTSITYLTLPYMYKGAKLYEMGSMSSFQPVPYIGVYGATKAYVLSLSRSLNRELKPRGIHVMAVCPFWVKTEFFDHAVKDDTISYYCCFYTPEQVVKRALKDMKKGRDVSICGAYAKAQALLVKLLPHKLVMHIWCRQQKKP